MIDNRLFEKYDGLIFDMDGTLIDTMPVHARAWSMEPSRGTIRLSF